MTYIQGIHKSILSSSLHSLLQLELSLTPPALSPSTWINFEIWISESKLSWASWESYGMSTTMQQHSNESWDFHSDNRWLKCLFLLWSAFASNGPLSSPRRRSRDVDRRRNLFDQSIRTPKYTFTPASHTTAMMNMLRVYLNNNERK